MEMLKELVACNLVDHSYVSIVRREDNQFQIQIRCDYNKTEMEVYAKNTD